MPVYKDTNAAICDHWPKSFLTSSDYAGNVRKFRGLFYFFWNSPCFHTSVVFFLFLDKYSELLLALFIVSRRPLKTFLKAVLWNATQGMNPDDREVNLKWVTNTYLLWHAWTSLQYFLGKDKHKIEAGGCIFWPCLWKIWQSTVYFPCSFWVKVLKLYFGEAVLVWGRMLRTWNMRAWGWILLGRASIYFLLAVEMG